MNKISRLLLIAAALLPATASAKPLDPAAVRRAEMFWAPYNGGVAPCLDSLEISYFDKPVTPEGVPAGAYTHRGAADCHIYVWRYIAIGYPASILRDAAYQCAVVAHEIGHNMFDLDHSDDARNVMSIAPQVVPRACMPPHPQPVRRGGRGGGGTPRRAHDGA